MKTPARPLLLLAVCCVLACRGQAWGEEPAVREMHIDPATTGVPLGKARLTVDTLTRGGKDTPGLQGHYKVEVTPISPLGEEGSLTIAATDETLRKLANGNQVDFSGQAVSTGGNKSTVQGTATPAKDSKDAGSIRVRIEGKKGKLVFKTAYHLAK